MEWHQSMEQIGDHHQFERQFCPVENISTVAFQSLDTVRALHQTVVSLRTALEEAHKEIDNLKKQIVITTDIEEGKRFREIEKKKQRHSAVNKDKEKADTDDNSNLKQVFDSSTDNHDGSDGADDNQQLIDVSNDSENSEILLNDEQSKEHLKFDENKSNSKKTSSKIPVFIGEHQIYDRIKSTFFFSPTEVFKHSKEHCRESKKHSTQMASKIDVKVKLSSNIRVDGSSSDTTTESNSGKFKF